MKSSKELPSAQAYRLLKEITETLHQLQAIEKPEESELKWILETIINVVVMCLAFIRKCYEDWI